MTTVLDRLRLELEQLGGKARDALEQGRLQIEKSRILGLRNDAARELGLLVYRRLKGEPVDDARYDALLAKLDDLHAQLAKVERELSTVKGERVSVSQEPPPPADTAESEIQKP